MSARKQAALKSYQEAQRAVNALRRIVAAAGGHYSADFENIYTGALNRLATAREAYEEILAQYYREVKPLVASEWLQEMDRRIEAFFKSVLAVRKQAEGKSQRLRELQRELATAEAEIAIEAANVPEIQQYKKELSAKQHALGAVEQALETYRAEIQAKEEALRKLQEELADMHEKVTTGTESAQKVQSEIRQLNDMADEIMERGAVKNSQEIDRVEAEINEIQTWFNTTPHSGKKFSVQKHREPSDAARRMLRGDDDDEIIETDPSDLEALELMDDAELEASEETRN